MAIFLSVHDRPVVRYRLTPFPHPDMLRRGTRPSLLSGCPLAKQVTADKCAQRLKAVADPDRLRVVNLLRAGPLTVGEMCDRLPMELANLSHHLGVLRASDIVDFDKQGRHRVYRLNPEVASDLSAGALDFGCCRLELDKTWKPAAKKSE